MASVTIDKRKKVNCEFIYRCTARVKRMARLYIENREHSAKKELAKTRG